MSQNDGGNADKYRGGSEIKLRARDAVKHKLTHASCLMSLLSSRKVLAGP